MRPKIHYTPPKNWCNDPNGLCYFNGEYHLFYQYFPYDCQWGTMHWGHASTKDFISYQTHDIALFPSRKEDMNGVFSGSAYIEDGKMHLFYTGVRYLEPRTDNIHVPNIDNDFLASQLKITSDDGYHFDYRQKQVVLPISTNQEIAHSVHTRDPKIFKNEDDYYMVIATKLETADLEQGKMNIYRSSDLENFSYFTSYTRSDYGNMWECPDFFTIDKQQFAIMSPENMANNQLYPSQATIQKANLDFKQAKLEFDYEYQYIDYGLDLYAPQTFEDEKENRVMIAWLRMPEALDDTTPYIGTFTMPRIISYKNNTLNYDVHPIIKEKFHKSKEFSLKNASKITVEIQMGNYLNIGGYVISYDGKVHVDRSAVFTVQHGVKMSSPEIKQLTVDLEIYVDLNIIEIFIAGGKYVISNIVYDLKPELSTNIEKIAFAQLIDKFK